MLSVVISVVLAQAAADAGVEDELDRSRLTVVTGTRTERKAADTIVPTEVITRTQIEQLGVRDLPQLLQQHPGVEMVYTNRGTGIRLQGLDPEYVLILVDGQRVSGRSGSITDIGRFSLREVERIEIVKGPAAALYGADAMGGVVNLITRRPQKKLEGSLRGMFGTLLEGDVRGHVGSKLGKFELRGGAGYRTREPFDWDTRDVASSGPGLRRIDWDLEAAWVPDETLRAWVRAGYVWTDLDAIDLNDSGAVFDRFQRTEQFDTWAGVRKQFSQDTTVTVRGHFGLFRDQFQVDQRNSRALDEYSRNLTRLWEAFGQVDHRVGAHTITGGVEGFSEILLSTRIEPSDVNRGRVGVWLQDEWVLPGPGPRIGLSPGFRVDADTQFGWAPSPRLAVKIDPLEQLTFRAAWGLGFRPPSFSELYLRFANPGIGYIVQGNPKLQAERSGSVNVAVDYRPFDGWVFSASAWHTSLDNLINITASGIPNPDEPVVFGYENVTNAYTQGLEVSGRMKLSRGAYLDLSYMGLDARDITRNRPLEGRSPHRLNATFTMKYRPVGLEAVVRTTWHSPRPFYAGSGLGFANVLGFGEERLIMAAGYLDLEAQLTYSFRPWLRFFVNGYNLLNSGDKDFNPRPPRGVIGGVSVEY